MPLKILRFSILLVGVAVWTAAANAQATCKKCVQVQPGSGPNPPVYECQLAGEFEIGFHECVVLPAGLGCELSGLCEPYFALESAVAADGSPFQSIAESSPLSSWLQFSNKSIMLRNCRSEVTARRYHKSEMHSRIEQTRTIVL